jgi:hypothetical protein
VIDPAVLGRLRALAGSDLSELAGATAAADIPLTNTLVNRVFAERLSRSQGPVSSVEVEALDEDTFSARVSLRTKMIPTLTIVGRIEDQPELPLRPVLAIRWSMPRVGPLGLFAGPALGFLKVLPPGLRADDDRILVDVEELVRSQGLGDLLPLVTKLQVHTRRGAFVVRVELRVR